MRVRKYVSESVLFESEGTSPKLSEYLKCEDESRIGNKAQSLKVYEQATGTGI
jgi:hypothetical protein